MSAGDMNMETRTHSHIHNSYLLVHIRQKAVVQSAVNFALDLRKIQKGISQQLICKLGNISLKILSESIVVLVSKVMKETNVRQYSN